MKHRTDTYHRIRIWLFATLAAVVSLIVLVGGFMLFQKQIQAREFARIEEAQLILQEVADVVYEFAGIAMEQVEALREEPAPDAWLRIAEGADKFIPREVAYYRADDSGADRIIRDTKGKYTTIKDNIASRAVPLFQRAQTLRAGEVYITPSRKSIRCDYLVCPTSDTSEVYAYVTPVYEGDAFLGALVVAYDTAVWESIMQSRGLTEEFFVVDAQGYYAWHTDARKRAEKRESLPSSFFTDFDEQAVENILAPSGGRVVALAKGKHAYMYPASPFTQMTRGGKLVNIPAPLTAPANQYFVIGFVE